MSAIADRGEGATGRGGSAGLMGFTKDGFLGPRVGPSRVCLCLFEGTCVFNVVMGP